MTVVEFREYCLSFPGVTEKMPFTTHKDPRARDILCFYVGSKWFCLVNIEFFDRCCVKLTESVTANMRDGYDGVKPAWHMNKRYWSDIYFNSDVPDNLIYELVAHSYKVVRESLPKREQLLLK